MTTNVNNNPPVGSSSSSGSSSSAPATDPNNATMTQSQFLQLMVAQLQAQDPTNPVDNSQFVSQMAQFSTLSATQDLSTTVTALSSQISDSMSTSQVLSSANLVGRQVLVPATTTTLGTDPIAGAANLTTAGDVTIKITDPATGGVIRSIDLGSQQPGLAKFTWDGKDDAGNPVAPGDYSISATSTGTDSLTTYVSGAVTGVGYGGTNVGTYLQVAGVGGVPLSQVAQIL